MEATMNRAPEIARLNDLARRGAPEANALILLTPGVEALVTGDILKRAALVRAIAGFESFEDGDDPYGERDFGAFVFDGARVFWKIDYCDLQLEGQSERPWCAADTRRVLTVMLASEY